jgi:hypothetical protein
MSSTLNDLKNSINAEIQGINLSLRSALEHAHNVGNLLIQVKAEAKKQKTPWLLWVKDNCGFGHNTATNYIRIAKNWSLLEEQYGFDEMTVTAALSLLSAPKGKGKDKGKDKDKTASRLSSKGTLVRIIPKHGYSMSTIIARLETMATVTQEVKKCRIAA